MIFVARARSFFTSAFGKRLMSGLLVAAMMTTLYAVPRSTLAQQTPPAQPAPSAAPTPTNAAPTPSGAAAPSGFTQIWDNTSSLTACESGSNLAGRAAATLVGGAGVAGVVDTVSAVRGNTGTSATGCIVQVLGFMITFLFSVITYFLSKLLILLTSVLIVFARYDKFNNAPPVEIGWKVIRDVVNIFFIVILLASAFMTIIGQAESKGLHYSKVLPGVITGAILVNFSRTLILLVIDASQVVTLTFISAFEGSIAGNIFQALGVTRMTQLQAAPVAGGAQATISIVNIAIAYLLAMFLLMTAVAMVLLYVGYFIFRIVGLWILIILSPIAMVASSMPKTFGSMFKKLQDEYDKRFTALIVGGPTIAFFLWLSFATIQRQSANDGLSGADMGFDVPQDTALGFITQIGTTGDLAGFIVAVILLGVGFSFATSTAGSVSPLLATAAKKVTGYRDSAFKFGATLPWRGVKSGAGYANQRLGLTNRVAQGIARGAGRLPTNGLTQGLGGMVGRGLSMVPGVGGVLAGGAAAAVAAVGAKKLSEQRKAADERIKALDSLPAEERVAAIRALDGGPSSSDGSYGSFTHAGTALAQHEALLKNRDTDIKTRQKAENDRIQAGMLARIQEAERAKNPNASVRTELTDEEKNEAGRQAKALATQQVQDDEAQRVARLRRFAENANDTEALDRIKKEDEKYMRYADDAKYNERVRGLLASPEGLKDLDASVINSGKFALAMLVEKGIVEKDTSGNFRTKDKNLLKEFVESDAMKSNKPLVASLKAVANVADGSALTSALTSAVVQKDAYGQDRVYATSTNEDGISTNAPLYSTKERSHIEALGAAGAGTRTAGSPLSDEVKSAIKGAMKDLPLAHIMGLVDKKGSNGEMDQAFLKYAADIAQELLANSQVKGEEAMKQIEKILSAAKAAGASPEVRQGILEQAFASKENIDKLFGDFYTQKYDKKAAGNLLQAAASIAKDSPAISAQMDYAHEEYFPDSKEEREVGVRTEVRKVKKTVKLPNADGLQDSFGRPKMEEVEKEVEEPVQVKITKSVQAPGFIRGIFYGMKSDADYDS